MGKWGDKQAEANQLIENALAGEGQVRGVDSLVEFLLAAKAARGS
jgi:hypothetical protein